MIPTLYQQYRVSFKRFKDLLVIRTTQGYGSRTSWTAFCGVQRRGWVRQKEWKDILKHREDDTNGSLLHGLGRLYKAELRTCYSDIEYSACLEECSVTHCGIDPFGALKEGFARLTGPVTFVTDVQAEFEVPDGRGCMIQLRNGISTEGIVFFDFVHHMSCDVLMITSSRGICIEKVEHMTNTYVRIGVVIVRSVQHTGDKVAYNLVGNLAAKGDWRSLTTSDHVPPRSIILV
jgi:hypothetical protein